jgi:hypothetical protein
VDLKEELLEDVPSRGIFWEGASESDELVDFGGDSSSRGADTRSYGLRVRRIGPPFAFGPREVAVFSTLFFGNVSAQFSHGMALFLSFSS